MTGLFELRSRFKDDPRTAVHDKIAVFFARVASDLFYCNFYFEKDFIDHVKANGAISPEEAVQLFGRYADAYLRPRNGNASIQRLIYDYLGEESLCFCE